MTVLAAIAMGANLGDRKASLEFAVEQLAATSGVKVMAVARHLETEPVGGPPQGRFLNSAMVVETTLEARDLLDVLLAIESRRGRVRAELNGPRVLDLDLILYGQEIIDQPGLTVPHPRAHQRDFVLQPLQEIAADWHHPTRGQTVRQLWQARPASVPPC